MSSPQVQEPDVPARARGPFFPRWLQTKEAAAYLGISQTYLWKLVTLKKAPPAIGKGRAKRYFTADLDNWLATRGGEGP